MRKLSGINIQWPISELILQGKKTIETRTYPVPQKYLNQDMIMIETPGKSGRFKSRMRCILKFTECFQYKSRQDFYNDIDKHCVSKDSPWKWDPTKPKWGWIVEVVEVFDKPLQLKKRPGIKFSTDIEIPD